MRDINHIDEEAMWICPKCGDQKMRVRGGDLWTKCINPKCPECDESEAGGDRAGGLI